MLVINVRIEAMCIMGNEEEIVDWKCTDLEHMYSLYGSQYKTEDFCDQNISVY